MSTAAVVDLSSCATNSYTHYPPVTMKDSHRHSLSHSKPAPPQPPTTTTAATVNCFRQPDQARTSRAYSSEMPDPPAVLSHSHAHDSGGIGNSSGRAGLSTISRSVGGTGCVSDTATTPEYIAITWELEDDAAREHCFKSGDEDENDNQIRSIQVDDSNLRRSCCGEDKTNHYEESTSLRLEQCREGFRGSGCGQDDRRGNLTNNSISPERDENFQGTSVSFSSTPQNGAPVSHRVDAWRSLSRIEHSNGGFISKQDRARVTNYYNQRDYNGRTHSDYHLRLGGVHRERNGGTGIVHPKSDTSIPGTMAGVADKALAPGVKDMPLDEPHEGSPRRLRKTQDPNHVSHQFFKTEPCLYSHRMFQRAARIFSVLKHDESDTEEKKALRRRHGEVKHTHKEKIPELDFKDAQEQIKTFELTFATLKFQKVFSHILDCIGFFNKYSQLNELYSLVYVILYDLQTRKFQKRIPFPDEYLDEECKEVEDALLTEKTRLQANIAKERIKHNAPSVDFLLPEHVRNKDETKAKTPVYLWVNQMKTTIENVISNLKASNFRMMDPRTDMSDVTDHAFLVDPHCSDLLTFPPHLSTEIKDSDLVMKGYLVEQDKSSCLAPQTVSYLLGHNQDLIHVNIGTGTSTCHTASLLYQRSPHTHIWAFGASGSVKAGKVLKKMEFLEIRNVKVMYEDFLNIDPDDPRFKSVRMVLISANCSKSAITSPVQFIVSEGEDTQILSELSVGEADMNHVTELTMEHERLLKHALKFPKLQAVVYTTRSRFELENEQVISNVLESVNATNGTKKGCFMLSPPVLPFSGDEINSGKGGVDDRYIQFYPTDKANGCFVAIVAREPEETKETIKPGAAKSKPKNSIGKSKSGNSQPGRAGRKSRKSAKGASSDPSEFSRAWDRDGSLSPKHASPARGDTSGSLKQNVMRHKSPVGVGARLYQKGLIAKMETKHRDNLQPEHIKVVKHPSPFR